MNTDELMQKYLFQKFGAARRGIGWELTFEQWRDWWGDDIKNRGPRRGQLCMMRIGDVGPYSLANIRKGTTGQNGKTRGYTMRTKRALRAYRSIQEEIDRTPGVALEPPDEMSEDEQWLYENLGRPASVWDRY